MRRAGDARAAAWRKVLDVADREADAGVRARLLDGPAHHNPILLPIPNDDRLAVPLWKAPTVDVDALELSLGRGHRSHVHEAAGDASTQKAAPFVELSYVRL